VSLINQTVGNYRVTKLLGEGGMGLVYLAEHPVIGRKVAIKVLHVALAKDSDIVARFFNEARAIHMIGHENIVEILDFGQTSDGQPYFIMEYLTGESLSDRISRGAISPADTAIIADQMCRALAAAHAKGIVHRDLKPHNVQLLTKADGRTHVKILDFGVAKILADPADGSQSVKTRTGSLMGTPLYMSPEQCKGAGLLDHRTDIYSLGVMIFEMLAGHPPFMAEGIGELFAKHMLEEAPQLLDAAPNTPPAMAAAVMKSLAKSLDDRFASMDDFRQALLGEVQVTVPAGQARTTSLRRPGGPAPSPTSTLSPQAQSTTLSSATSEIDDELKPPRRKTGLVVGGVGVAAAAVVAVMLFGGKHAPPAPPVAVEASKPQEPVAPPPLPSTVTIRFEAPQTGAHVFRKSDDKDLGVVPLEVKLPRNNDTIEYVFRKQGYKDLEVIADISADRTLKVSLDKAPPAPEEKPTPPVAADKPASHRPTPAAHRGPRRSKNPAPDEDGLATPSF
jgi:serine/threonine-protein kinase